MSVPSFNDLKKWVGELFTNEDWDFNFETIANWFSGGQADLKINSLTVNNGIDANDTAIINIKPATVGTGAVNLDQAETLLNRTSYYYPFSVASGKVDLLGGSFFLQKDSDIQLTILAGGVNPDLTVIQSDATVETLTTNAVLAIPIGDGSYRIIKEKGETPVLTSGKVTIDKTFPLIPASGDYFLSNCTLPFKGYRYDSVGGWQEKEFCYLGVVVKTAGTASLVPQPYNQNFYNMTVPNNSVPDYTKGVPKAINTTHVADKGGFIEINSVSNQNGIGRLYINDVLLLTSSSNVSIMDHSGFFISKGDTYRGERSGVGYTEVTFYPLKGDLL